MIAVVGEFLARLDFRSHANNAFTRLFWEKLSRSPELAARVTEVFDRERDPLNAFSTGDLLRMVGSTLLQGRFDVLPAFFKVGQKMEGYKKEVARRRKCSKLCHTAWRRAQA